MKIITGKIKMNYTNLFVPRSSDENEPLRYSLSILLDEDILS